MRLGAYQLEAVLGDGATGVVWRATLGDETVAIKVLRRDLGDDFAQALSREVHALAALNHPNIVSVLDFDHVRADEATNRIFEGQPYVVFEYGSRGSLEDYLRGGPQISWPWVRSMLMGTLDALAHAHARDFIHRDLKPANIIGFDRPAGWKLADFGLAFLRGETEQHKVFGTPQFMAPEQFHGQAYLFGPHTDLYALGCMAYQLVCGRLPFAGPNLLALANAHLSAPIPDVHSQFVVPEGFSVWLAKMLAKNPRDRFELAADAAAALGRLPSVGQTDRVSSEMFELSMETVALSLMGTQISEDQTLDFGEVPLVESPTVGSRPSPAPQPPTWRKPTTVGLNPLLNASPRLFALRAHDLIGRDVELDRLWTLLVRVRRTRQVRSAVITGPEGSGKTHLARWFATRAGETGSADVFVLGTNLRASILRHARLDHYTHERQVELLTALAEDLGVPELTHLDGDGVLMAYLAALAERRPVIVLIDNIQNHHIGQHVLEQLLALNTTMQVPMVILATQGNVADDDLRDWMKGADEIILRNLGNTSAMELIGSRLKLGAKSCERVLSASEGNPRMIVDVLEQWFSGDQLTWTGVEFEAKPGAPIEAGAWKVTLERILAKPEYKACLKWAATLGTHVHWLDWSWLCRAASVTIPDELVGVLVRSSLARWTDEGFDFSNGLIPEVICPVKPAAEAADILVRLQKSHPAESRWEVIGELYVLAGEFERAMDPLERAASWRGNTTALVQKRRLLGMRWEAAQRLGDPHLAASAELSYLAASHQLDRRSIVEIEAALTRARAHQWPDLVSKGLMVLAQHQRWKQRFDLSLPYIQEALEVLQAAGLPTLAVEREYADLLAYADRHEEAMEAYLVCMKTYQGLADESGIAWCHYGIGYIEQQWGNQTEALKHLQKAADWYRRAGDLSQAAAVDNSIGDCLFMLGRYEEARVIAESAARQYNREGRHIPEAYANLALIAMALDEVGEFKRYATLVARYGHDASHYWGVLAGLAALEHDWEKWDDFVSRIATGSWDRKLDIANSLRALLKCTQIAGDERRAAIIEETERDYRAMIAARMTPR